MTIVFSDLDGTLLHLQTYSYSAAQPALVIMKGRSIPLIFCTSKTRAEVEFWRRRIGNNHPFIVENGGAMYVPRGYFPFALPRPVERERYEVIEYGARYDEVVEALRAASRETGCRVLGFHDMTVEDISRRTLLPLEQAQLAKRRDYDEPFEILSEGTHALLRAIEMRGLKWTRGDRFYHISGNTDKAVAVRRLAFLYRKAFGAVTTVGIGDGQNDLGFLRGVEVPIVIRSGFAAALKAALPRAEVTKAPGPHGWNEAVLGTLGA